MGPGIGILLPIAVLILVSAAALAGFLFAITLKLAQGAGVPIVAEEGLPGTAIRQASLWGLVISIAFIAALFFDASNYTNISGFIPKIGLAGLLIVFIQLGLKCFEAGSPIGKPTKVAVSGVLALIPLLILAVIANAISRH